MEAEFTLAGYHKILGFKGKLEYYYNYPGTPLLTARG